MDLSKYNLIVINSSGGKDSLCALYETVRMAKEQGFPMDQIVVSHQDLGDVEWKGTKELVKTQADLFGLKTYYSKRRDKNGHEGDLLQYVEDRGKWPGMNQRYCTSDFKRGPGARIVTMLTKGMDESRVLYVFGFRKEESPARSKKEVLKINKKMTTKKRTVHEWLPIHEWDSEKVWKVIKENNLPYHPAYDLGMSRLSCCFCVFASKSDLMISGKANPELLDKYVALEEKIGHSFKSDMKIKEIKDELSKCNN